MIILAGVSINLTLGDDGIIKIAKKTKENMELAQIEEQTKLNELYMQIGKEEGILGDTNLDFLEKINEFKRKIAEYIEEAGGIKPEYTANVETFGERILGIVKEVTKDATATPRDITLGKTAYVNGEKITGTMPTLEEQTQATATEEDILNGKTAWVNGSKVTGSMVNQGAVNQILSAGSSYTIPKGYHNGSGKITASTLANANNFIGKKLSNSAGAKYTVQNNSKYVIISAFASKSENKYSITEGEQINVVVAPTGFVTACYKNVPVGAVITINTTGNNWAVVYEIY